MPERADGSALAGGLLAAALLDALVDKGALTIDDARSVIDKAMRALGPDIQTPVGYTASQVLQSLLVGKYSKRSASK
jgi:polyhydroxyalkanoate synthesis regulator phasin